jgi:hypothetical protein
MLKLSWPFKAPKMERRAVGSGFTAELIAARESYISGRRGLAELTATVQACVSLWEAGLSFADLTGTGLLRPSVLAMAARALALRGEAVFLIDGDRLRPASDWDVRSRGGEPTAYRLTVAEAGGGGSFTALSGEVLHFRIGADAAAPWAGQAPLRRAALTAGLLEAVERALRDVFEDAPIGSQIVSFPESTGDDLERLSRGFRGRRGSVLLRESTSVTAAGAAQPQTDWVSHGLTPDLQRSGALEALAAARDAIAVSFGVLPGLLNPSAAGPAVREAQRHLAQWVLQPMAWLIAQEASEKLGAEVKIDVLRPLQAFDTGGRARALAAVVQTMIAAREGGLSDADMAQALALVDWDPNA